MSKTIVGAFTGFLYDGVNAVQEQLGGSVNTNLLAGPGVDEFFTRTDQIGTHNFLTNALGSTLALSDPSGSILTQYTYEPFGNTSISGSLYNPFQFTGRENDGTGLYSYRARYYNPVFQRFISQDPIGLAGGVKLYAYVSNSPLNFVDPFGLDKQSGNQDNPPPPSGGPPPPGPPPPPSGAPPPPGPGPRRPFPWSPPATDIPGFGCMNLFGCLRSWDVGFSYGTSVIGLNGGFTVDFGSATLSDFSAGLNVGYSPSPFDAGLSVSPGGTTYGNFDNHDYYFSGSLTGFSGTGAQFNWNPGGWNSQPTFGTPGVDVGFTYRFRGTYRWR